MAKQWNYVPKYYFIPYHRIELLLSKYKQQRFVTPLLHMIGL